MDLGKTFPYRALLNVTRDVEKRLAASRQLEDHGVAFVRLSAIDPQWLGKRKKQRDIDPSIYARSLSLRLAIRAAARNDTSALMVVDDRIHINDVFHRHLAELDLPSDWGLFLFGCRHIEKPTIVQPGLVRVTGAISASAMGMSRSCFRKISRSLYQACSTSGPTIDQVFLALQKEIPTYAPFPNLVEFRDDHGLSWKGRGFPEPLQSSVDPTVAGVMAQSLGFKPFAGLKTPPARPAKSPAVKKRARPKKTAFLFSTIGNHPHPGLWQGYWNAYPEAYSVYSHTADVQSLSKGWLRDSQIERRFPASFGDITSTQVRNALLLRALEDPENRFFVFVSEGTVPVRPLRTLTENLRWDSRSRFAWADVSTDFASPDQLHPENFAACVASQILPRDCWVWHHPWLILERSVAQLAVEEDLTEIFAGLPMPDTFYFGTVLRIKGYPMADMIVRKDYFQADPKPIGQAPGRYRLITPEKAADLNSSGYFFSREYAQGSNIGRYGLHVDE